MPITLTQSIEAVIRRMYAAGCRNLKEVEAEVQRIIAGAGTVMTPFHFGNALQACDLNKKECWSVC